MFFEINKPVKGMQKGAVVQLDTDHKGVPVDEFWRRRYNDGDLQKMIIERKKIEIEIKRRKK